MKFLLFIWGACWSSFITTMSWRYLTQCHPNYSSSRSICDYCEQKIKILLLVPILGFLIQGGNCKICHNKINPIWTIFEFINGLIWMLIPLCNPTDYILFLIIDCCLLALCVQDWFDQRVSCLLFIGLVPLHWLAIVPSFNVITFIWVIILCFGYFVDSIGNGDIDFIVITTLLIGPTICMRAVAIACFLGLLYACLLKQRTLPFIPFLSWGLAISLILQEHSSFIWF